MNDSCPKCLSDLRGDPIPAIYFVHYMEDDPNWDRSKHRSHEEQLRDQEARNEKYRAQGLTQFVTEVRCFCLPYGDKAPEDRFFSRKVGHEVRGVYDGILIWNCPDCGHNWPRFSPDPTTGYARLHDKARQIIARWAFEDERTGHVPRK